MTERLTLALVTVALAVLMAVTPVSAAPALPGDEGPVIPGVVTIVAAGNQSYFLGDEITFTGTNTATDLTYLFLTGPNLPEQGSQIQNPDPVHWAVEYNNPSTFQQAGVKRDHTWYWKWDTANYGLAEGVYTIYVVARPDDKNHLEKAPYGTVSVIFKKPLGSATPSLPAITRTAPVATKTPSVPVAAPTRSPGFGALIALTGLGAVVFIVIHRH